jgi:hypothetical protein
VHTASREETLAALEARPSGYRNIVAEPPRQFRRHDAR